MERPPLHEERKSPYKPAKRVSLGERVRCDDGVIRTVSQIEGTLDNKTVFSFTEDEYTYTVPHDESVQTVPSDN